jgi:holo-[acyl-carrier protein] synthase
LGSVVGVGIDLVDIARFARALERRPGLAARLFSEEEQGLAAKLVNPAPTLAGRFAVKEAGMKALGVGIGAIDWTDLSVERAEGGAPRLVVTGRASVLAARRGIGSWHVSISHTDQVAAATVVAES